MGKLIEVELTTGERYILELRKSKKEDIMKELEDFIHNGYWFNQHNLPLYINPELIQRAEVIPDK